ncbi:MAG: hypothetical protein HQL12_09365, partial [Candidatus Omnitrophica bacterium]|nr:hypothetical protein [Candidatus Omnitrophota bacterium]
MRTPFFPTKFLFKAIAVIVLISFAGTFACPITSYAQEELTISRAIGSQTPLEILPLNIKGLAIHSDNPGKLDFILDSLKEFPDKDVKNEAVRLFKYFLAALTVPQDEIWVNLSPYEHDRMIPVQFGYTEMGRDFLIEDYALKQLTASLIYPEGKLGKAFWNKVYQKAYRLYGTTDVPINTFNRVWIIPDHPAVYVRGQEVFVIRNHLKVLSEKDFLASSKYFGAKAGHVRGSIKT